ncbi:MAG: ankyrin repeat domain-containing protein [Actinomycetota bacterium]|nr:ankyrin repeat domain-containing protein [Actinomycetota bacterium]
MTALFDALRAGDATRVHRLLHEQPQLARDRTDDGISAILWALYVGEPVLAEHVARVAGTLDVFEATALGEVGVLRQRLEEAPDAVTAWSSDGFTALHLAAFFGQPEAATVLLAAGAPVDLPSHNAMRVTPLQSAAAGRRPRVVALLLDAGANPLARQSGGWTPLHSAAHNGDRESVRLLLAAGGDPQLPADDGRTPIQMATGGATALLAP